MTILFIFLILENILERFISILNYSDEIITVLALFALGAHFLRESTIKITKYNFRLFLCFLAILTIGIIATMRFSMQKEVIAVVKDILAISKFYIIYLFGVICLNKGIPQKQLKQISLFSKVYTLILFICGCINLIADIGMSIGIRNGIRSYVFLYSHETFLVSTVVIMMAVLIVDNFNKNKVFIAIGFIVLGFTLRSKSIIFILAVIVLEYIVRNNEFSKLKKFFSMKTKIKLILAFSFIIAVTFFFVKDKLSLYISFGLTAARPALYITSLKILADFFPLGSGFGTFASYISGRYYSPLYSQYGIQYVNGLDNVSGYAYISDTYWPYIIAQFGLFGSIIYLYSLFLILKNILKMYNQKRESFIAALSVYIYMIGACFVESLLTNANIVIIALSLSYYLNLLQEYKVNQIEI